MKRRLRIPVFILVLGALAGGPARGFAQDDPEEAPPQASAPSRDMRIGLGLYQKGDDERALEYFDRVRGFGTASEQVLAREYTSRLSRRDDTGALAVSGRAETLIVRSSATEEVLPLRFDPAAMKADIRTRMRRLMDDGLEDVKTFPDIKIILREDGAPRALGIPSSLLFDSGRSFRSEAREVVDGLVKLAFGLGVVQMRFVPEGLATGETRLIDVGRVVDLSSQFLNAGVSAARVHVRVMEKPHDFPNEFNGFKGIVLLFAYDAIPLATENPVEDQNGPALSLGVYADSLSPAQGEGALIEFSVRKGLSGLDRWHFWLYPPVPSNGAQPAALEEFSGSDPVFKQLYWNGRQNYFGPSVPPGRYECVLTATDGKHRHRTLHRWIQVRGPAPEEEERPALSTAPATGRLAAAPAAKKKIRRKAAARKHGAHRKRKPEAEEEPSSEESAAQENAGPAHMPSTSELQYDFGRNSHELSEQDEKNLSTTAQWLVATPAQNVTITGYAQNSEMEPGALAQRRAQMIAGILINRYQIEMNRVFISSNTADTAMAMAQITLDQAH